jgi:hypothetical protein
MKSLERWETEEVELTFGIKKVRNRFKTPQSRLILIRIIAK